MADEDKNVLVLDFRKWWRHLKTIYYKLPFVGPFSTYAQRRIKHWAQRCCKNLDIKLVFAPYQIKNLFSAKDAISKLVFIHSISSLYITPTSGSLVFATDDGCWSSEICIVNLKLCVYISKIYKLILWSLESHVVYGIKLCFSNPRVTGKRCISPTRWFLRWFFP